MLDLSEESFLCFGNLFQPLVTCIEQLTNSSLLGSPIVQRDSLTSIQLVF